MRAKQEEQDVKAEEPKQQSKSLRSRAFHFVSDFTSVLLNPISDKPSRSTTDRNSEDDLNESEESQSDEEDSKDTVDGPDTSSFAAFLYSLLGSSDSGRTSNVDEEIGSDEDDFKPSSEPITVKHDMRRRSILSRGKKVLGKAMHQVAKLGGFHQAPKSSFDISLDYPNAHETSEQEGISMQTLNEYEIVVPSENLPELSDPSQLLSEKTRSFLYSSLPVVVQGRRWLLLYSTWRHGISLSTLYRRSMLWPGLSLLVVGDRKGAAFGGLVEAPMKPTNKKYQGTNTSFVFSNTSGQPVIYRPTGVNRYFTLCSMEYLAMGGGSHFALYLDSELLSGSSSSSETYGNPCLATSQDFVVKEVELWGFVYASKYDEMVALSRIEAPGICRW